MVQNIFETERPKDKREKREYAFYFARVTSVPRNGRSVLAQQLGVDESAAGRAVTVPVKGDVAEPQPGDIIAVMRGSRGAEVVVGTVYEEGDVPSDWEHGDRRIGNRRNDSNVNIKRRGEIELNAPFAYAPRVSEDPDRAGDGAVWYNTTEHAYKGVEDGEVVTFQTE